MLYDKTVCYKINSLIDMMGDVAAGGSLSARGVAHAAQLLHEIRQDAQNMETALKRRKKIMEEKGIEGDYQKEKNKDEEMPGVNKVGNIDKKFTKPLSFEFIIKENGKTIYQVMSHGGVLCTIEKIEDMDADGMITGTTQKMFFGHPLSQWYAYDQLTQAMEGKKFAIMAALREVLGSGALNKEARKKVVEAMNR